MAVRSPRASQRREVLRRLRELNDAVKLLGYTWKVEGRIWVEPSERVTPDAWLRERRLDEYPENDAREWRRLASSAEEIARQATDLARYARASRDPIDEG